MDTGDLHVEIRRPVYKQDELNRVCDYVKPKSSVSRSLTKQCGNLNALKLIESVIPFVGWIRTYNWKNDLIADLIAGVTVAIMHVPQGMGYALLGNMPPVVGVYMGIFPAVIYVFLGTSRHNSMGSFAVVSLMIGKLVLIHSTMNDALSDDPDAYSPVEVGTVVTFMVGLLQVAMYFMRLGIISSLLSDSLVSGFTTGAAVHVLTSQVKDLVGLRTPSRVGIFKIVLTYYDVFGNISSANLATLVISACSVIALTFNIRVLKPMTLKRCPVFVPMEAIVVTIGIVASLKMDLPNAYDVSIVGEIPVGIPTPTLPRLELLKNIWLDCFVISIVSYAISQSMALIFAQRNNYEVNANQELLAQGAGNFVGSFFFCMPFSASVSRSSLQEMVGGRTQITSLISLSILLCVLLWIAPYFEPLPKCILACIIAVALSGMLLQVREFFKYWRLSRVDGGIWMATFLTVVFIDIEYGLGVGVCLSIVSLVASSMRPYACRVGLVPGTEMYLDVKRYKGTTRVPGVEVLHYCGCLNFASRPHFKSKVHSIAGIEPQKEFNRRSKMSKIHATSSISRNISEKNYVNGGYDRDLGDEYSTQNSSELRVIVLDFSALLYIDAAGVGALRSIVDEFKKIDVDVYISGCSGPVFETMRKCDAAEEKSVYFVTFATISDAVHFALRERQQPIIPVTLATNQ